MIFCQFYRYEKKRWVAKHCYVVGCGQDKTKITCQREKRKEKNVIVKIIVKLAAAITSHLRKGSPFDCWPFYGICKTVYSIKQMSFVNETSFAIFCVFFSFFFFFYSIPRFVRHCFLLLWLFYRWIYCAPSAIAQQLINEIKKMIRQIK